MKFKIKSKKASLSLSINAIVVLILAITMLGLGLGFMKKTFSKATNQFLEVSHVVKKQMINQLKDSGEPVVFSAGEGAPVEMQPGEKREIYLAIRNVQDSAKEYEITNSSCSAMLETSNCNQVSLTYPSKVIIKKGDADVLPVIITLSSSITKDNLMIPFTVTYDSGAETVAQKDLSIKIK